MNWSEKLRQLDNRLADGGISTTEYRRLRDEILAEASSPAEASSEPLPWHSAMPGAAVEPWPRTQEEPWWQNDEPAREPSGTALRVILVTLLVAVLGGGIAWFALGSRGAVPGSSLPSQESIEGRLPALPGKASRNNATLAVERAVEQELITKREAELFALNGVDEIVFRGSTSDGIGLTVVVAESDTPQSASAITTGAVDQLRSAGYKEAGKVADDLVVLGTTGDKRVLYRTAYTSGVFHIRIGASAPIGVDERKLRQALDGAARTVRAALPVG